MNACLAFSWRGGGPGVQLLERPLKGQTGFVDSSHALVRLAQLHLSPATWKVLESSDPIPQAQPRARAACIAPAPHRWLLRDQALDLVPRRCLPRQFTHELHLTEGGASRMLTTTMVQRLCCRGLCLLPCWLGGKHGQRCNAVTHIQRSYRPSCQHSCNQAQ